VWRREEGEVWRREAGEVWRREVWEVWRREVGEVWRREVGEEWVEVGEARGVVSLASLRPLLNTWKFMMITGVSNFSH